jgi:hypothetical protein
MDSCVLGCDVYLYRVYQEVPAKLVGNVSWVSLGQKNQTYPSPKLNSYGDKGKKSFKESEFSLQFSFKTFFTLINI